MDWTRQGAGLIASVRLHDGRTGKVVLVGSRNNPKGAVLVLASQDAEGAHAVPLHEAMPFLSPRHVVEILCTQERAFGESGLAPVELP